MGGLSLRTKFLAGTIGLVALLGLSVTVFVRTTLTQTLLAGLQKRGISITRNIAERSSDLILTESITDLQLMVNDHSRYEEDIEYIFVLDPQREVLAHTFGGGFPVDLKEANVAHPGKSHRVQLLVTETGTILDIAVPVLGGEVGIVHVGISEEPILRRVADVTGLIVGMIAAVLLVGGGAAGVLAVFLTKPVLELTEVAKAVGGGNLEGKVRVRTRDEIGRLGVAFNEMIEDLRKANLTLREEMAERKRMEQELIRLERLRATGELSAGISHNLNNILTSVMGPAQLLERMTDDPRLLSEIEDIVASATRAKDLVRNLHQSTRTVEEAELEGVAADSVIYEAVQATRPRWKDESEARGIAIKVETRLEGVPPVRARESGLHEILVNLLFNAVDALPEGGRITVATRSAGDGVELTVTDTGDGMEEKTRRRVFEPFFTTKADVGTGLGLSTAHAAVQRWGGTIDVESAPGEGTTFTVRLPVWEETQGVSETPVLRPETRRARLLVVEDDMMVARLLERVLGATHEVSLVQNGLEVLDTFATDTCEVAVIDLGMPGLPGDRVAQEMRQRDPTLATVLITGWEIDDDDARLAHFDFRIQKPFDDLDEVVDVVARAIELHDERATADGGRRTTDDVG